MLSVQTKKKLNFKFWLAKSKDELEYVIKQAAQLVFAIAGISVLRSFTDIYFLIDAVSLLIIGLGIFFLKSRVASILVTFYSIVVVIGSVSSIALGFAPFGILINLLLLYFSVSAVISTFKYHKK